MKILTIANRKGGAGKSTCAAHLAIEAFKAGIKTIVIDLDPQKTLESWWNKREEDQPFMADADSSNLEEKIKLLTSKNIDLCIIDTPGDTSPNAIKGIQAANLVLIPSKATAPDLTAIGRTITTVREYDKEYVFLLTQIVARTKNAHQALSVLSEFGAVAPSSMANRVSYSNAIGQGSSAAEEDRAAAEELKIIWDYLYGRLFNVVLPQKKKIA